MLLSWPIQLHLVHDSKPYYTNRTTKVGIHQHAWVVEGGLASFLSRQRQATRMKLISYMAAATCSCLSFGGWRRSTSDKQLCWKMKAVAILHTRNMKTRFIVSTSSACCSFDYPSSLCILLYISLYPLVSPHIPPHPPFILRESDQALLMRFPALCKSVFIGGLMQACAGMHGTFGGKAEA